MSVSGNIEVINRTVQPVFANTNNFDLAIYTDTSNQAIHIGCGSNATTNAPLTITNSNMTFNGSLQLSNRQINLSGIVVQQTQPTGIPQNVTTAITSILGINTSNNTNFDLGMHTSALSNFRFLDLNSNILMAITTSNTSTPFATSGRMFTHSITASNITTSNLSIGTTPIIDSSRNLMNIVNIVGIVLPFAGTTAPVGWMFCHGQSLNRADEPALFAVIGVTYGQGNTPGITFSLPDLRGRVPIGKDDMGGTSSGRITSGICGINGTTLGAAGGDQRLHAHTHGVNDPGHAHGANQLTGNIQAGTYGIKAGPDETVNKYGSTSGAFTGITIQNNTHGGTAQNVQPSIVLNYIIKL